MLLKGFKSFNVMLEKTEKHLVVSEVLPIEIYHRAVIDNCTCPKSINWTVGILPDFEEEQLSDIWVNTSNTFRCRSVFYYHYIEIGRTLPILEH